MKPENHFANRHSCNLQEFRQSHFICNELFLPRSLLLNLCQKAGFVPNIVRTSNEQEWFDDRTVDFGQNIVLCPIHRLSELLVHEDNLDLRVMPLEDYFAQVTVGIASSKVPRLHPPIMEEFYRYTRQELGIILSESCEEGRQIIARQSPL